MTTCAATPIGASEKLGSYLGAAHGHDNSPIPLVLLEITFDNVCRAFVLESDALCQKLRTWNPQPTAADYEKKM